MMDNTFPLAERGVYAQPYMIGGRREFVAVSSTGEHVASRLVRDGKDPEAAILELWGELDEVDPLNGSHPARLTLIS